MNLLEFSEALSDVGETVFLSIQVSLTFLRTAREGKVGEDTFERYRNAAFGNRPHLFAMITNH
jgi:hypothetical protein